MVRRVNVAVLLRQYLRLHRDQVLVDPAVKERRHPVLPHDPVNESRVAKPLVAARPRELWVPVVARRGPVPVVHPFLSRLPPRVPEPGLAQDPVLGVRAALPRDLPLVEVPAHDDGAAPARLERPDPVHLLAEDARLLSPRLSARVARVGAHHEEAGAGVGRHGHERPARDPVVLGRAHLGAGDVGRAGQPEGAVAPDGRLRLVREDGAELAPGAAVAPLPDAGVVEHEGGDLVRQGLLGADDGGALLAEHGLHALVPKDPRQLRAPRRAAVVLDVERHDLYSGAGRKLEDLLLLLRKLFHWWWDG